MVKASIKIGDIFPTNQCGDCVVLEYVNCYKVKVKFITTGYECWCYRASLRKGLVKDLYCPTVYSIGYLGEGEYISKINGKISKEYYTWRNMIERCYSVKNKYYHRYGGREVVVCEEWHNFQNFAAWVVKQPNYNKDGFQLDKDLRIKDSKEYSPNTCSFVPARINTLLVCSNKIRGDYPIGVYWDNRDKVFISRCRNGTGKVINLGSHSTPEQAFQAYKEYKENLIKQVATEEFDKGNIIKEVYDNLMKWEVVPFPE